MEVEGNPDRGTYREPKDFNCLLARILLLLAVECELENCCWGGFDDVPLEC